jgi:Ca2+-binding EF-hand superfamily protein
MTDEEKTEASDFVDEAFEYVDADGDGEVNAEELEAACQGPPPRREGEAPPPREDEAADEVVEA